MFKGTSFISFQAVTRSLLSATEIRTIYRSTDASHDGMHSFRGSETSYSISRLYVSRHQSHSPFSMAESIKEESVRRRMESCQSRIMTKCPLLLTDTIYLILQDNILECFSDSIPQTHIFRMHPFSPLSVTTLASLFTASPVLAISPVYSSYVAFGDSFSAGPGAGSPYPNDPVSSCQRYADAYPVQCMQHQSAKMPGFQFQFSAWSRAQVLDVLNSQVNDVLVASVSNASIYTLTVGGNDLGFGGLVISCVYGLGWLAGACDDLLGAFDSAYASGSIFRDNLDEQLNRIVPIAGDASKVVIMPYIKLFDGDVTDDDPTKVNCHVKQYVCL